MGSQQTNVLARDREHKVRVDRDHGPVVAVAHRQALAAPSQDKVRPRGRGRPTATTSAWAPDCTGALGLVVGPVVGALQLR